ncbi:hypothetical protein [Aquimarina sp. LLG6339-5]|uniref:hypothetical protein n=1 Tax=Aquimarina sp. LLG6339-5 TaxID=3160830 RepID=UPI00386B9C53
MKLYKPLFSIIVIIVQLILSLKDYYELQEWKKANPELDSLISLVIHYDTLFLFVLIIGVYEMQTKPSLIKKLIRILLVCIVFGYSFSGIIPIEDFKFGVYNTAWFSAVVAIVLILIQIGKYGVKKINKNSR